MKKLFTLFTGDDEEIRKVYYGKGILTGLPFIVLIPLQAGEGHDSL